MTLLYPQHTLRSHDDRAVLFLGSYPPRECGIATFTADMVESYGRFVDTRPSVIAIDELGAEPRVYPGEVIGRLLRDDRESYARIVDLINRHSSALLNVQHEYGLFGGDDGEWFLDLLDGVRKPSVVTLHTVLPEPSPHHRDVARAIGRKASAIVVLSQTGKSLLTDVYGVDPRKIHLIHHGVPDVPFAGSETGKAALGLLDRPIISTFGLINRGKGLEYAIEAMRIVVPRHPQAVYLILGGTHPEVRRQEGESYRQTLLGMIETFELGANVQLVDYYLPFAELIAYLRATDIYLTPYLDPTQIVSGTLAYAVGCGKAIVSTPYLYARELLADERGLLAKFRDPASLAENILSLLDDPMRRRAIERRAHRFGRQMTWPQVASQYRDLFASLFPSLDGGESMDRVLFPA